MTVLRYAVVKDHKQILEYLVKNGYSLEEKDRNGMFYELK